MVASKASSSSPIATSTGTQRLAAAYGPSALRDGKPVCLHSAGAVIAGCVPLNPLGGLGSISQEALDYTSFTAPDSASLVSKGYYANISGEIVQLPAGALGFAAGYEYRKETGQFDPDAFIASGLSTGNGAAPTKGGYDLNEFFVELSIPQLRQHHQQQVRLPLEADRRPDDPR
ncbi:hypothetical protein G6F57_018727 [Rhizopus arrhizus]|nr:hypothetical protein G6F57_018727 [Rhizopus arrhizus]